MQEFKNSIKFIQNMSVRYELLKNVKHLKYGSLRWNSFELIAQDSNSKLKGLRNWSRSIKVRYLITHKIGEKKTGIKNWIKKNNI